MFELMLSRQEQKGKVEKIAKEIRRKNIVKIVLKNADKWFW